MAQIAVTTLSLSNLSRAHWVARGLLVFSLTSALVAVYYATTQQRTMGRLLTAKQVRSWIRGGTVSENLRIIPGLEAIFSQLAPITGFPMRAPWFGQFRSGVLSTVLFGSRPIFPRQDPEELDIGTLPIDDSKILEHTIIRRCFAPSVTSVITLSAPQMVLTASLGAFIIALGIYLGFTWTRGLDAEASIHDSRNVFIMYTVGLGVCITVYSISSLIQDQDVRSEHNILKDYLDDYIQKHPRATWAVLLEKAREVPISRPMANANPLRAAKPVPGEPTPSKPASPTQTAAQMSPPPRTPSRESAQADSGAARPM